MDNPAINDQEFSSSRADLYRGYIEHQRDTRLRAELGELVENAKACLEGAGSRRRALFLIGASGSGKSFALRHHFSLVPEFQETQNVYGETYRRILSIEAPKQCTAKDFAIVILDAIGVPSRARMTEGDLYKTVKTQLRERGILYLHVDEAQHLIRHKTKATVFDVQERLKSLMQIEDWPLHTIYSGVPQLADLLSGDQQLANRSRVMRFVPLNLPADRENIEHLLTDIAENKCGLVVTDDLRTDDFLGRLCHANRGCYGSVIESVRAACLLVMSKGKREVDLRAFAFNYQREVGCLPSDNIFTAKRWSEINPDNALADLSSISK